MGYTVDRNAASRVGNGGGGGLWVEEETSLVRGTNLCTHASDGC